VRIEVLTEDTPEHHDRAPEGPEAWELVGDAPREELVPATGPPPLHLLRRGRLSTVGEWTPARRVERAFELGKADGQVALDSGWQVARDNFPVRSAVYILLYDPTGDWPRYTRSLQRFYQAVKDCPPGREPGRTSPWKQGVVSRGFPSIVEAEAYLEGASCRLPREEF
jgi:hypothetical protein